MKLARLLSNAAFDGNVEVVSELLDRGAGINECDKSWNPLHAAIENGQIATVEYLIERGADIESINSGMTPLAHAVEAECDGLVQQGLDVECIRFEMIEVLLDAGCDPKPGIEEARSFRAEAAITYIREHRNRPNKSQ